MREIENSMRARGERHESGELVMNYDAAVAERNLKGQDCVLVDPKRGLYVVFDGMGGVGDGSAGQRASRYVRRVCAEAYSGSTGFGSSVEAEKQRMTDWLTRADSTMADEIGEGGTTAVALRLVEEGGVQHAVWANVGDSRLYLFRGGQLKQLSQDEGEGHVLTNAISSEYGVFVNQVDSFRLESGDRLMLCSDGITGDYEYDMLFENEIIEALTQQTPRAAANELLRISRKQDDKSVIVLDCLVGQDSSSNIKVPPFDEIDQDSLVEYELRHDERLPLSPDHPIVQRLGYSLLALVRLPKKKELSLLDIRYTPKDQDGKRRLLGSDEGFSGDYLLVDKGLGSRTDEHALVGCIEIPSNDITTIGRARAGAEKLGLLSPFVSREHVAIANDSNKGISIVNQRPKNRTRIAVSPEAFMAQLDT